MPKNNDVNNFIYHQQGAFLPGVKFPSGFLGNAGSGNVDLYTCPAGKRASVSYISCFNSAGTTTTIQPEIYVSGTYYKIGNTSTVATTAQGNLLVGKQAIILEAGEKISVNTSQAGMNFWANIVEFDNTAPIKTGKILTLSNGNNTLYTCPAGKKAVTLDFDLCVNYELQKFLYFNNSGGSRTITWYAVPNGSSPGTSNTMGNETVNSGLAAARKIGAVMLNAGDFIVVNTTAGTATQTAWVNVMEL